MLLGADKGASGVVVPGAGSSTGGVPPLPTLNPATPLAPPPLPEGASAPALADRVSLSPRASQALQAQGQSSAAAPPAAAAQPGRGVAVPPAAIPTLAAAGAGVVTGAAWPASGVSPAMRGLLDALVQQLTPAAPQRVVAVQPWGAGLGGAGGLPADPDLPPLQTWLVGQGLLHTEQGPRAFTATLRVPAAWLQSLPTASSPSSPTPSGTLQAALAGRSQALTSGLFALVLQPGVGAGERAAATSALLSLDLAPWHGRTKVDCYGFGFSRITGREAADSAVARQGEPTT